MFGKKGQGNIIKHDKRKNQQRYLCKSCQRVFTATKGFFLYRRSTNGTLVLLTFWWIGKGFPISAVAHILGSKSPDTIRAWLRPIANDPATAERIEAYLKGCKASQVEINRLWSRAKRPGYETGYQEAITKGREISRAIRTGEQSLPIPEIDLPEIGEDEMQAFRERFETLVHVEVRLEE